jgi:fatty-acyl-CoA synthase
VVGGLVNGYEDFDEAIATHPADRLENETAGAFMLYSSGTTGRPKGIKRRLPSKTIDEHLTFVDVFAKELFAFDDNTTYLSPAPLYHSAPAGFCVAAQSLGGTAIVLENFDPVVALEAIERHRVTHSQWVPTMFVRMLKIPEADRNRFDLSSHSVAIHAAAPCPRTVKEQMLEWWGPILHEYYSATEATGMTYVGPQEWLAHPGTVGRPVLGALHICDESGSEVLRGTDGMIYFERDTQVFQYHNAPEQTRSAHHPEYSTWATLGDVGHVDDEGFLYLTDRAHFTIVAGGVNIYPQEIEDVLVLHPVVLDVGVIGVPNPDLGEEVKAVVQLVDPAAESPEVELELIAFARERLARFKVPRSIDFVAELPRLPTGKLYKRKLRDAYWAEQETNII